MGDNSAKLAVHTVLAGGFSKPAFQHQRCVNTNAEGETATRPWNSQMRS